MVAALWRRLDLGRFVGRIAPVAGPVRLDRRRIYILPTRAGFIFALVLLAMLIGAINYENSLGFALTFLLGAVAMVAMVHTFRNLHGLSLRAGRARSVFVGDEAAFPVAVSSPDRARLAVNLALPGLPPVGRDLPADGTTWVDLHLRAGRRGRMGLPRIGVFSRFPLGLFHAWGYAHLTAECIVYPAPAANARLPPELLVTAPGEGDLGRGSDDFAALRPYHAGDSLRHVHWKAVARGQGMLTKQFGGESAREMWLGWEMLPARLDTEARLSLLCRWVVDAEAAGLTYGLALPALRIAPARGDGHRRRCLEALALFGEAA